jgi:hypothetical protein
MPYKRVSGFGNANDGGLKFDLKQFDQTFFERMRSRIIGAGNNGMTVSIMLFDVYAFSNFSDTLWRGNIFNGQNNINGIDTDPNNDGWGYEFFYPTSSQLLALQKEYVKKVIDTVNDLDNVIYEIANELGNARWQYDMINYIKSYESFKPKQHLIWMSPGGVQADASYTNMPQKVIVNSPAHIFATDNNWGDHINDPPVNHHGRPGVIDMDHAGWREQKMSTNMLVPWKAFTRGYHFNLYDEPFDQPRLEDGSWETIRKIIGGTVAYANKVGDLAKMLPSTKVSSTQYALANPGAEYLVYQPGSGAFTVNLVASTYSYEWFNPVTGSIAGRGSVTVSSENTSFTPPFTGQAVLYLKASTAAPPPH